MSQLLHIYTTSVLDMTLVPGWVGEDQEDYLSTVTLWCYSISQVHHDNTISGCTQWPDFLQQTYTVTE